LRSVFHWTAADSFLPHRIRNHSQQARISPSGVTTEFGTLLNESAGGVLLAIRKPLRRWSRVTLEIPSAPLIKNLKLPRTMRMLRARVIRIAYADGWNPLWAPICPTTRLITQNRCHWFTVYFHASLSEWDTRKNLHFDLQTGRDCLPR